MNEAEFAVKDYQRRSAETPPDPVKSVKQLTESLSRALDLLSRSDSMGAIMEILRARDSAEKLSAAIQEPEEEHPSGDLEHDWRIVDPYTVECRICGAQRPRLPEERLFPLPQ